MRVASTIAELAAIPPETNSAVYVLGSRYPGDGGGGLYVALIPKTAGREGYALVPTWTRLPDGLGSDHSIRAFGAVVDSRGDDRAAISAADAAAEKSGGMVRVPSGTSRIGGDLALRSPVFFEPGGRFLIEANATVQFTSIVAGRKQLFEGLGRVIGPTENDVIFPEWWGARADDRECGAALQAAINAATRGQIVSLSGGSYRFSQGLLLSGDSVALQGRGRSATVLKFDGGHSALRSKDAGKSPRRYITLRGLQLLAPNSGSDPVLDLHSCQFSKVEDCWVAGSGRRGTVGILLGGKLGAADATYNTIMQSYVGLVETGLLMTDVANSNILQGVRFQPSVPGGSGAELRSNARELCNHNVFIGCSFEFPGRVSTGIRLGRNAKSTVIFGCRFESLRVGIEIAPGATQTYAPEASQLFSSCASRIENREPTSSL